MKELTMKLVWPDFPRVTLRDETILILFEDGKTMVWGVEEDPAKRKLVIMDIQEGLRAIKFLSDSLKEYVETLFAVLVKRGFSDAQKDEYLRDAIRSYVTTVVNTPCSEQVKTIALKNPFDLFYIS